MSIEVKSREEWGTLPAFMIETKQHLFLIVLSKRQTNPSSN